MAYKYTKGKVNRGDIYNEDDAQGNTFLDWSEDAFGVVTGGSATLVVSSSTVGIGAQPDSTFALDVPVSASIVRMGRLELGAWPQSTTYGFLGHSNQDHHGTGRHAKYNLLIGSAGDLSLNSVAGQDMYFRIGAVIKAAIDSNGFFSIGPDAGLAWTPTSLMHLSSSDDSMIFICHDSAQSPVLAVTGSGRVGIGTDSPDYTLDVAGNIGVDEYIYHNGDADTYIQFSEDEIVLYVGGRGFLKCQEDSTDKLMINYGALDIDLQVKGENQANLFRTDAANDRVGIGSATPASTFEVSGSQAGNYTQIAGSITVDETHYVVDYTGNGDAAFTLPNPSGVTGRMYHVVSHAQGANDVLSVTSSGTSTTFQGPNLESDQAKVDIEGTTPQSLSVISTGTHWFILHDGRSEHGE